MPRPARPAPRFTAGDMARVVRGPAAGEVHRVRAVAAGRTRQANGTLDYLVELQPLGRRRYDPAADAVRLVLRQQDLEEVRE